MVPVSQQKACCGSWVVPQPTIHMLGAVAPNVSDVETL